jgi:hypothetical protein
MHPQLWNVYRPQLQGLEKFEIREEKTDNKSVGNFTRQVSLISHKLSPCCSNGSGSPSTPSRDRIGSIRVTLPGHRC